ncbi:MAG: hypothetical protein ACYDG8_10410 [Vulcanimicrobiaceae bacterium]
MAYFELPTDYWPVFNCPQLAAFGCPPRIGATTAGAANPGGEVKLSRHFAIFVPHGEARNPYTGTNWEGVGVIPNIKMNPEAALLKAYILALNAITDPFDDAVQERRAALRNPPAALRMSMPEVSSNTGGIVP